MNASYLENVTRHLEATDNEPVLEMKIWIYLSESDSWIYFQIKTLKFTGLNNVLLVLGRRIGAPLEDLWATVC